jgi:dihydrofolate synthase/folylpolyglutamate synthase
MTYQESIKYLYNTLPMFSRIGASAIKTGLDNTIALCEALGNPHKKFKSIHIAGTNGKGSVSHMLAAVMQTAGYKTGLYTSPHLKDFRERIKINGALCDEQFVIDFTTRMQPLIETLQPSFFELTVAMAFEYFALQQVDVAIIETGLGGRLDSTNVISPELSVITNIGWDHMNILGNTLELIASEKAGIIKPNTPVVIGEALPETKPVFINAAQVNNAPIIFAQEKKYVTEWHYVPHNISITLCDTITDARNTYALDLTGIYQTKNIVTLATAVHQLQLLKWSITDKHLTTALAHVKHLTGLHGRWELLQENPAIIADVAHNIDGMLQVKEQLEYCTFNKLHIVIGMVKDKDVESVLKLLPTYATYYFTKAQIPRAMHEDELAAKALALGLQGNAYAHVQNALNEAKQHAHIADMILVCGSVFVVGEVI